MPPPRTRVSAARRADLDQIMEIEELSFPTPWSRRVFEEELGRELSHLKVIRLEPTGVVAFVNYWVVHDEIHVLNVATHPEQRRQGHARRLMEHVLRISRIRRARLITLEVRRGNQAAQRLYTELGFLPIGVRPRYYENAEDAIVMMLQLRPDDPT
jgi:ribosomal-protein-alanine N-acetyltransferase